MQFLACTFPNILQDFQTFTLYVPRAHLVQLALRGPGLGSRIFEKSLKSKENWRSQNRVQTTHKYLFSPWCALVCWHKVKIKNEQRLWLESSKAKGKARLPGSTMSCSECCPKIIGPSKDKRIPCMFYFVSVMQTIFYSLYFNVCKGKDE